MNKTTFKQATLGIRYLRTFRIPEVLGDILDTIVSDEKSPFFRESYTYTQPRFGTQGELQGRILVSEEKHRSLVVDIDNVILNVAENNLDESVRLIKDNHLDYIQKNIFGNYEIKNITRLGFLVELEVDKGSVLADEILSLITNKAFANPEVFSLRFSERKKDPLSFVLKEYYDFQNHIVAIEKTPDHFIVKYDFQLYFKPHVENILDLDIRAFINTAKNNLESKFMDIFKKYDEEQINP